MRPMPTNQPIAPQGPGTRRPSPRARAARRGFTLLESAMATVILAVGVLALVEAQTAFTRSNDWSSESARASYLAGELRERLRGLPRHDPQTPLELDGNGGVNNWGAEEGRDRAVPSYVNYDDLDDYDSVTFGAGGTFDGPIDGAGRIIPATTVEGEVILDDDGNPVPLIGWSQSIRVEKVAMSNPANMLARSYWEQASGSRPEIGVADYPLRVTVTVRYQGPFDAQPREMAVLTWVQP